MKPFLKEVAEDLVHKFGEDLQHTAIIFNNKRPIAYLQNHLATVINKPFWSPSFYTIQEFFALATSLKTADAFTQFFTLFNTYNNILLAEGETSIALAKFYPIARIILSDFAQIDNDLVDAEKLFSALEDLAEIDFKFDYLTPEQQDFLKGFWTSYSEGKQKQQQQKFINMWRRMPVLYKNYHLALKEKGLTTMANTYRQLAANNTNQLQFTTNFKKLIFVGFNALSKAEEVIFKRWQKEAIALFYFDTDTYYLEDKTQEAGLFLRKNLEKTGLINALGESKTLIKAKVKTVNVYQAQGQTAQAKILHQTLQSNYPLLKETNNAGKIALILADESLLLPVLQTIPTQYNDENGKQTAIDLNVTMGYPLVASAIFGLADLWLTVQSQLNESENESVNFKTVTTFLSHPLAGIGEKTKTKILNKLIEEQLVNVPSKRLIGQKGLFELFFNKLANAQQAIDTLLAILKYILEKQLALKTLKQKEADLFVAVIKELNKLHDALKEHLKAQDPNKAQNKDLAFVLSLIQKAIKGIAVPLTGEPLQGIQVMGLLESRSLDFEQVYILGANEGILPQNAIATSFIPDGIRRAYGLPVIENQDAISAYMFYRLLQRSKKIDFIYNAQTDQANTGEPSRFLRQLAYESGYQFNYLQQQSSMYGIETENNLPVLIKKDAQIMGVLNKYLTGETRLSATALTTYISCPLQFFYKYVAKIEEPKEVTENVAANYIGLMLHWVMESFYADLRKVSATVTKEEIKLRRKNINLLCKKAYAFVVFKDSNKNINHNGMQKVVLAIVAAYANIILTHDETLTPFELIALEKRDQINYKFNFKGVEKTITLHGIIDRIDCKNGITRLIDYKTGNDDLSFTNLADVFDTDGKKQNKALIQTLFYTHVYEQANAIKNVEPNLYIMRKKLKEGTLFIQGTAKNKAALEGDALKTTKAAFIELVNAKLTELFDENIPFIPTTNPASFVYSPYTTLCGM